ncbi:MAG: M12 family metallo-peptidase [Phycisphaerales bacterium]
MTHGLVIRGGGPWLLALAAALSDPVVRVDAAPPRVDALLDFTTFAISAPPALDDALAIPVALAGEVRTLDVRRHTVRAPDARLLVDAGDGRLAESPLPPSRTYAGVVVGEPGSSVRLSVIDDGVVALVERADGTRYFIEPLRRVSDAPIGAADGRHVAYRSDDVRPRGLRCGVDDHDFAVARGSRGPRDEGGIAGATKYLVAIACDADYEFFQKNGASLNATVDDIESVLSQVDFIYDRDVDIDYEISTIVVRTSVSDPYVSTDANAMLCEFRTRWNASPESEIKRDVAHLFTGKQLDGSTIGLGWVGVVCNQVASACSGAVGDVAYSIAESRFVGATMNERVGLSCHEIGHNWGASHCDGNGDCHIMCASINGCSGINGANLKFGAGEQSEIVSYRDGVACDFVMPSPVSLPFSESWSSTTVSTSRWTFNDGGVVSTAATNEPSSPYSINLDSTSPAAYGDDELRSAPILCGGAGSLTLRYFTQHKGVESGESLEVDYWSDAGQWVTLAVIVSDGVDETSFVEHSHALPSDAKHDGLRIRFRTDGNESNDDWYVDDISIAGPPCLADFDHDGDVDAADLATLISEWGPCIGCVGDLSGNGVVNGQDITLFLMGWGACP